MKLVEAINDLIGRTNEVLEEEAYSDLLLDRVYRMKRDLVDPAARTLRARPKFAPAAEAVESLYRAVEEYVVCFQQPRGREERRHRVEGLQSRVRRELLGQEDREGEVEHLLDEIRKWQVKTSLDSQGRLVYCTPGGTVVPARGRIAEKAGAAVIEQAVKAQKPYADRMRPRDARGEPGGMIRLDDGERAIVVGDLHGRYDNLENILSDKNNLQDILAGKAHLIFCGDAVHPSSSAENTAAVYEDSFCVMLLIMTLKAENPFNVHYLIGNHDNAHVGGLPAGRGQVRQDKVFKHFVVQRFGKQVFKRYCEFVETSPVTAKIHAPNGHILLVHACLSPHVTSEADLINIFVDGRQNPALQDLLWSRCYEAELIRKGLQAAGARFVISGHTTPTERRAGKYGFTLLAEGVAAHAHQMQVVLSAQGNVFGYADIDMLRPLPEEAVDLTARDGRPAFRIMKPRRAGPPAAAAEAPAAEEVLVALPAEEEEPEVAVLEEDGGDSSEDDAPAVEIVDEPFVAEVVEEPPEVKSAGPLPEETEPSADSRTA